MCVINSNSVNFETVCLPIEFEEILRDRHLYFCDFLSNNFANFDFRGFLILFDWSFTYSVRTFASDLDG